MGWLAEAQALNGPRGDPEDELRYEKWLSSYTPAVPLSRTRILEFIRRRLERVVRRVFIDSPCSVDEFRDWRRRSEISDPLRLHDVLD